LDCRTFFATVQQLWEGGKVKPARTYRAGPAFALVLLVFAAACGGATQIETRPTPTASQQTQIPTFSPPPDPSEPERLTRPEDSALHLFEAWKAGDRAAASEFAQPEAVDEVFSRPYTGPEPEFQGCAHDVDHYLCNFRYEGGATIYRVDGGSSAGYFVTEVSQVAD
jgi:hypothetical protein